MRKFSVRNVIWLTLAILTGMACAFFVGFDPVSITVDKEAGQVWPAWLQAGGSVAAIFSVALVAWWEERNRERERKRQERNEEIKRKVRANRILGRFVERIDAQLAIAGERDIIYIPDNIKPVGIPDELWELEPELHLIGKASGYTMTAMDAFMRAESKIGDGIVRITNKSEYLRELKNSRTYCVKATSELFKFLDELSRDDIHAASEKSRGL